MRLSHKPLLIFNAFIGEMVKRVKKTKRNQLMAQKYTLTKAKTTGLK